MSSRLCALVLAMALLSGLAGCAPRSIVRGGITLPYEEAARRDLAEAHSAMEQGDAARAVEALERFAREVPQSKRLDEALLLLGDAQLQLGDSERAALAWQRVLEDRPRSRRAPEAAYRAALAYRGLARPELARSVLERAPFERASDAARLRSYRLLADLSRELGDYTGTVRALALVRREAVDPDHVREVDLELEELLTGRLRDSELAELVDRLPRGPVYDRVLLELASRELSRGEVDLALATLERLPQRLRPRDESRRQSLVERAQRASGTGVYPIGVALPLSGPYAAFGRAALRGVVLGLEIFAEPPGRYRIVVRDTAGSAERALEAIQALTQQGVRAVIGPVSSSVAEAAAPAAQQARVPLLTLAKRAAVPDAGDYVFRLGVAPSDQIALLAEYALRSGPTRRFAILYPRDSQGIAYKNLFWDEMERRGGTIVGVEGYPPGAVDIQDAIKKLVGLYHINAAERALIEERDRLLKRPLQNAKRLADRALVDLPPYVDFDALFIPDVADRVALVLPQLRFYDVTDALLLGPNDWNDPKLVEIAGRDARGAVFTGAFHVGSGDAAVQRFVAAYQAAYGESPNLFGATGYDAAALVRSAVNRVGRPTSRQLLNELMRNGEFVGVTGLTGFGSGGHPRRELRLLRISRGKIVETHPVPANNAPLRQ